MLTSRSRATVNAYWLGSLDYSQAWDLQRALVAAVRTGESEDVLLLLEHPHVFTVGRRGTMDHVLWDGAERERRGIRLLFSDRGGDATYHGPGQLVGYPILDLRRHGGDILAYLRLLEASLIHYLAGFGLNCQAVPGLTGVWCGGEKVAAIGVKLSESVVSHGFALNLTTDLTYFQGIVPCGLSDKMPTSLERLTGRQVGTHDAAVDYAESFAKEFGVRLQWGRGRHLRTRVAPPVAHEELRVLG